MVDSERVPAVGMRWMRGNQRLDLPGENGPLDAGGMPKSLKGFYHNDGCGVPGTAPLMDIVRSPCTQYCLSSLLLGGRGESNDCSCFDLVFLER